MNSLNVTIQMKAPELYFFVILFVFAIFYKRNCKKCVFLFDHAELDVKMSRGRFSSHSVVSRTISRAFNLQCFGFPVESIQPLGRKLLAILRGNNCSLPWVCPLKI